MSKDERTSRAVEILRRRYVKDDPDRKIALEAERVNAQVARLIHDLRDEAGLTQKELAGLIGTTQSVVSRLEDADYEGHSLSMLTRIAKALNQRLAVVMTAKDPQAGSLRYVFQVTMQNLRKAKKLSMAALAERVDTDEMEVIAMERSCAYRPTPLMLHKLGELYQVPAQQLAVLAGAMKAPEDLSHRASAFAAKSESFAKLSKEEQKALDEFVGFLRTHAKG